MSAGEEFDAALQREAGEELFDDGTSPRVRLTRSAEEWIALMGEVDLASHVLLRRSGLQKRLRDVRHAPGGGLRNVLYHVAMYAGVTQAPLAAFRPQPSEIGELAFFQAPEVDRMLAAGRLAPNKGFLWLSQALAPCTPLDTRRQWARARPRDDRRRS